LKKAAQKLFDFEPVGAETAALVNKIFLLLFVHKK
jgi:hypothetical protein